MPGDEVTLYLAPWQKRMIKDFMPAAYFKGKRLSDITKLIISKGVVKCPASYKIPPEGIRRGDWVMHLTDEQMVVVKEQFGVRTPITSLNIDPGFLKSGAIQFK
jgi:hypothetical protein